MFALRPKAAVLAGAVAIALSLFSPGKSAHACSYSPIIGTVCLLASNSTLPNDYLRAQGQLLQITAYKDLYALIGTIYGGDGRSTFALPDLRGRVPVGQGKAPGLSAYNMGQRGGVETVTQSVNTMAAHTHVATATAHAQSADAATAAPSGAVWANIRANGYSTTAPNVTMLAGAVTVTNASTGGGQAMTNIQPFLVLNWVIATYDNPP